MCHFVSCTVRCVLLIVYIKDVHVGHVFLIDSDTVPTGILGIMVSCVSFCKLYG